MLVEPSLTLSSIRYPTMTSLVRSTKGVVNSLMFRLGKGLRSVECPHSKSRLDDDEYFGTESSLAFSIAEEKENGSD